MAKNTPTTSIALLLAACSGGSQPGSATVDAPAATADAGADASHTGADAAGDPRFMPCELGRSWSYTGSQTYQGTTTDESFTTQIIGQQPYDGRTAFVGQTQYVGGGGSVTTYVDPEGADDTWGEYSGDSAQWLPFTKGPVQEGVSWTYSYSGTRVQTWHAAGQVTVAAGTFDSCWRIDYVVVESSQPGDVNFTIVCRGVGSVRSEMTLSNGFSLTSELISKSF